MYIPFISAIFRSKKLMTIVGLSIWVFASWLTHVIVCIKSASCGFLIAGAIFAPIGMVHGTGVWFDAW